MDVLGIVSEALQVTVLVFIMMAAVELVELKCSNRLSRYFRESGRLKYVLSSLLGTLPGCAGSYIADSFYMAGLVGFGSIVATMTATIGDEAFYILSLSARPGNAVSFSLVVALCGILYCLGCFRRIACRLDCAKIWHKDS
jgi:hypothetical protein